MLKKRRCLQRIETTQLMKRKKKSNTHRLKKPTDEKLYQCPVATGFNQWEKLRVDFETDNDLHQLGCFYPLARLFGCGTSGLRIE
jgi:hypothetical protein